MRYSILLVCILSVSALALSNTIIVPDDYPSIQAAIDIAVNWDTVLVKPGTYVENINYLGKTITLMSEQGPEVTVIDGKQLNTVVTFGAGHEQDTILDGFTITNADGSIGSGIVCWSSPTLKNNIISANNGNYGGGITCWGSPTIDNNDIFENIGDYGGGIYCKGEPLISNNRITLNSSTNMAGGIFCQEGAPVIAGNILSNNKADGWGGGMHCLNSNPVIVNNIVYCNSADSGSGISCYYSTAIIASNTIFGNTATDYYGGGIYCHLSSNLTVSNTILWNNYAPFGSEIAIRSSSTLSINHSDMQGGAALVYLSSGAILNWGSGMIDTPPLFVNDAIGDYHIIYNSPCRDSGDNSMATELVDFEGDPRIAYGTVDMGADEFYTHLYITGDKTPGGAIQGKFVGLPGTSTVGLFVGSNTLPSPLPTMWGEYWLQAPWLLFTLVPIPGDGVLVLPTTLPGSIPAPYDIPMQALIGLNADSLTNLCVLEVR